MPVIIPSVGRAKARVAALARHHGRDSLAYLAAKVELDAALRMAIVLDVAEAYPDEFRHVARQLLAEEVAPDAS